MVGRGLRTGPRAHDPVAKDVGQETSFEEWCSDQDDLDHELVVMQDDGIVLEPLPPRKAADVGRQAGDGTNGSNATDGTNRTLEA